MNKIDRVAIFNKFFKKIKLSDIRLFIFPILLIAIYEMYAVHVYGNVHSKEQIYPSWGYHYFSLASMWLAFWASTASDRYGRKPFLIFCIVIAFTLFLLTYLGYEFSALLISPLFFSTPIANAALIDNHEHLSVKKLMCFSYISRFTPWSFFANISLEESFPYLNVVLIICLISAFIFIDKFRSEKHPKSKRKLISKKVISLMAALLCAQIVFWMIVDNITLVNKDDKLKLFTILGLGSLIGTVLCYFSKERHEDLITFSFTALLLLIISSFIIFLYWGPGVAWETSLAIVGILGGFYLPVITERTATILGREHRGFATGLVDLTVTIATLLTIPIPEQNISSIVFAIILIIFAFLAYAIQRYHTKLIRRKE
jgi:MFS family permease